LKLSAARTLAIYAGVWTVTSCFTSGCYSFSGAQEQIRENEAEEKSINSEIQKEMDREKALDNSTNPPPQ